jgi:hypothetical protein
MFDQQMARALAAADPLGLVERLAPDDAGQVAAPATPTVGSLRAPGAGSAPGVGGPSGEALGLAGTPAKADAVARGVESGRAKDV